jgi:undecaprenyl-diphosphatase
MSSLQAIILGLLQGLTEFLPVSSSGHLVLGQHLLHVQNPGIFSFDVYVHLGTLIAVCVILWKDVFEIIRAMWKGVVSLKFGGAYRSSEHVRLGVAILVGTIPAAFIGLMYQKQVEAAFTDPKLVAVNLVITGLLLFLTRLPRPVEGKKMGIFSALIIGIAQACAILPGISRSGSTMSTAIYLRFSPVLAARFSFLLSIPVIAGAVLLEVKDIVQQGTDVGYAPILLGTVAAAISGYFAIKWLLKVMERGKFSWFSFYCLALGVAGILFI